MISKARECLLLLPMEVFSYFFVIIFFHWAFEKCLINEADLELAKIEQHLIRYYLKLPFWLKLVNFFKTKCSKTKNETKDEESNLKMFKQRKRRFANWFTWRLIYEVYEYVFGKSQVEIALEKIKRKYEFDQLKIHA